MEAYIIKVEGVVQGVGFRPFVYRIAHRYGIKGYVKNLGDAGVEIFAEAPEKRIKDFVRALREEAPPLARVENMKLKKTAAKGFKKFEIKRSSWGGGDGESVIPPDVAICDDCLRELFDPKDRRYLYPFIVCTNCGPRFSIIEDLPYDRENTSMREFEMCEQCRKEYEDPLNRRYHAEPICCEKCGPRYELVDRDGVAISGEPIAMVAKLIDEGKIVAIKGIGGFHIACDATNDAAVKELRRRLGRETQPFAVMARDLETVESIAELSQEEREELVSYRRPIVLLRKRRNGILAPSIAPYLHTVGVMLPYAGVHYLLFHYSSSPVFVMTSANYPDMPMVKDNEDTGRIREAVDYFLMHNRRIVNRVDDSVVRFVDGRRAVIRRSRGFVPLPHSIPFNYRGLALGAELMNTFAVVKNGRVYPAQYIGNTSKIEVMEFMRDALARFEKILRCGEYSLIIVDSHPLYNTTRLGKEIAEMKGAELLEVQHHYAHIATLLLEKRIQDIVGIAVDGVGYGSDGRIWGGEIVYLGREGVKRYSHLSYYPLPGGDLAAYYPFRALLGLLWSVYGDELKTLVPHLEAGISSLPHGRMEFEIILRQLERGINLSYTSSAGRLLDAVASMLDVCQRRTYEGEPAMRLESVALRGRRDLKFQIPVDGNIHVHYLLPQVLDALRKGECVENIAYSVHLSLARALAQRAIEVAEELGVQDIGVSGGVSYNHLITGELRRVVEGEGFRFHVTEDIPRGDNGISSGQAYLGGMYLEGYVRKEEVR